MAEIKKSVEDIVLDQLERLVEEKGHLPWTKPYPGYGRGGMFGGGGFPMNLKSGKEYRGINVMFLWATGYTNPYWVTWKQAQELKGRVRKEEAKKYTIVVFWKRVPVRRLNEETGEQEKITIPFLRYYRVYNVEQCEGIQHKRLRELEEAAKPTGDKPAFEPIEAAQKIADEWFARNGAPKLRVAGDIARYNFGTDVVTMPEAAKFNSQEEYHSTLFHEMTHSTGHKDRLDRKGINEMGPRFCYSREELVAEIGAAMLCGYAGIANKTVDNSARYIGGWMSKLRNEPKLLSTCGAAAQKAIDMIRGISFENREEEPSSETKAA